MADYVVKLEGAEEMIANLQKIDSGIRSQVALKAVNAGAGMIEDKARQNAPVKTGALRNSAHTISRIIVNGAEAEIGFRGLAYAKIQEFGGFAGRNHSVKITGKHYLGNAIESTKTLVVDAMSDVVKAYLGSK